MRLLLAPAILALLPLTGACAEADAPGKKKEQTPAGGTPRVAVFRLAGPVTESPADDTFSLGGASAVPLKDLVARMKKAADDPAVKAVVLLPEGGSLGLAQTEEVRQAMRRVRSAGKGVYAHADSL